MRRYNYFTAGAFPNNTSNEQPVTFPVVELDSFIDIGNSDPGQLLAIRSRIRVLNYARIEAFTVVDNLDADEIILLLNFDPDLNSFAVL